MTTEQNITKKHCGLVVRSGSQPPWDLGSGGTNNSACLCLHAEKISVLEFKVASSGLKRMKNFSHAEKISVLEFKVASSGLKRIKYFSLVQRAHFPVTILGLKRKQMLNQIKKHQL